MSASPGGEPADLLVIGAKLIATCDAERRELAGGWEIGRASCRERV